MSPYYPSLTRPLLITDMIYNLVGNGIAGTNVEVVVRSRIAWVFREVKFFHLVKLVREGVPL